MEAAALAVSLCYEVIAGLAIAGMVAGTAAVTPGLLGREGAGRSRPAAPAPAPAGGGPKREHFAFASDIDYLDGPALEALGLGKGCLPTADGEGNLYLISKYSTCRIRCARADGRVVTIAGNDRWPGNLKLAEGPASFSCRPAAGN